MRRRQKSGRDSRTRTFRFALLSWATLSVLTAIVGPFSTFDSMSIGFRLVYWGGIIGAAVLFSEAIQWVVAQYELPGPFQADLMGSVLMALLFGLAITVFNDVALAPETPFVNALGTNILVVALVCAVINASRAYIRAMARDQQEYEALSWPDGDADALPSFLRDIDPEIAASVRWIEADDHYLRVHAPSGTARVLMRFRDALEELAVLPGLRVHLSYWVRIADVTEVRADGRRHFAIMPCGSKVPVSRSYLPDLRAAGLLPRDAASERQ